MTHQRVLYLTSKSTQVKLSTAVSVSQWRHPVICIAQQGVMLWCFLLGSSTPWERRRVSCHCTIKTYIASCCGRPFQNFFFSAAVRRINHFGCVSCFNKHTHAPITHGRGWSCFMRAPGFHKYYLNRAVDYNQICSGHIWRDLEWIHT